MEKYVIALGYFDTIHLGHLEVFSHTVRLADELQAVPTVFTFSNDIFEVLGLEKGGAVNSFEKRKALIKERGIREVFAVEADKAFLNQKGEDFLKYVISTYNAIGIVVGEDYTCGKDAKFRAEDVAAFCMVNGLHFEKVALLKDNGIKISSGEIKTLLAEGKIQAVNELLGTPFYLSGKVVNGRHEGRLYGFPTVNIALTEGVSPQYAVYETAVTTICGEYKAVTNVGGHPTIGDGVTNVESHLIGFSGNLYDTEIRVRFVRKLRDIVKFTDKESLFLQISADVNRVKEDN